MSDIQRIFTDAIKNYYLDLKKEVKAKYFINEWKLCQGTALGLSKNVYKNKPSLVANLEPAQKSKLKIAMALNTGLMKQGLDYKTRKQKVSLYLDTFVTNPAQGLLF